MPARNVPKQYAATATIPVNGTTASTRGQGSGSPKAAPAMKSEPSALSEPSTARYAPRDEKTTTGLVGDATSSGRVPAQRSADVMFSEKIPVCAATASALPMIRKY